jgi:hypothetical protein
MSFAKPECRRERDNDRRSIANPTSIQSHIDPAETHLMSSYRTRIASTALLMGLSLSAACDSPTASNGGGTPAPTQPTQPAEVSSVQISPDTMTLLATGGHRLVQATPRTASGQALQGRTVSWTSSDVTIAVVDASGNVTGIRPGRAWITASVDGRTAQARVDVLPLTVDSIAFVAPWVRIQWGTVRTHGVNLYAADGRQLSDRTITWGTSDSSVATVDAEGRITAHAGGRAWITATSEGRTARAEVIVPDVKVMTLGTADGAALPAVVQDTIYDEGNGERRHVRVVALEGRLSLHSRLSEYQQRVVLRVSEHKGTCTAWGSCIWETEGTVEDRVVYDRGEIQYNVFTGEPMFASSVVKDWVYYAQAAPGDALAVWQALPGTGAVLSWVYRL